MSDAQCGVGRWRGDGRWPRWFGAWLWLGVSAVAGMLNGPFLLPGLLLVGITLLGGITLVVLILHNQADEQDHTDRHQNWFRLIERDLP